uniref:Uncharacterized protein n=1 Tax=Arundo donax TaxID=35708 RepID=A0A0A9FP44_ARUDO
MQIAYFISVDNQSTHAPDNSLKNSTN